MFKKLFGTFCFPNLSQFKLHKTCVKHEKHYKKFYLGCELKEQQNIIHLKENTRST